MIGGPFFIYIDIGTVFFLWVWNERYETRNARVSVTLSWKEGCLLKNSGLHPILGKGKTE